MIRLLLLLCSLANASEVHDGALKAVSFTITEMKIYRVESNIDVIFPEPKFLTLEMIQDHARVDRPNRRLAKWINMVLRDTRRVNEARYMILNYQKPVNLQGSVILLNGPTVSALFVEPNKIIALVRPEKLFDAVKCIMKLYQVWNGMSNNEKRRLGDIVKRM